MRILVATHNRGKLQELRQLLARCPIELVSFNEIEHHDVIDETGDTFVENALIKARTAAFRSGLPTIADDSGLEVDALNGAPGVRSARFAGSGVDDATRNAKLLQLLADIPADQRTARFRCVAVFLSAAATPEPMIEEGICEGAILSVPRGQGGFGYDPIFRPACSNSTFAELSGAEKDRISHRGIAIRRLLKRMGSAYGWQL